MHAKKRNFSHYAGDGCKVLTDLSLTQRCHFQRREAFDIVSVNVFPCSWLTQILYLG